MIYSASIGFPHLFSHGRQNRTEEMARDELAEWNSLLTALTARMRLTVGASQSTADSKASSHSIREIVPECATDLDLLHVVLHAEKVKRHQLALRFNSSNAGVVRSHRPEANRKNGLVRQRREENRDSWRIAGSEQKYLEAYSKVEALELQLEKKLLAQPAGSKT